MRGYALVSQDIRRLIFDGRLITQLEILDKSPKSIKKQEDVESRIQPSSFEPVIEDKVFILDTDVEGLFRGCSTDTIYRNLLRLPKRRRQEVSISDGFQINVGSSYLFPLREKVRLEDSERMRSSPKSTRGRDFIN
ncbi:2'-deoxycytidine 5'-triphosphate deaminase [Candidatus Woesearchaeota archaeon]|nr:2'-deoxycytidine 5'-triphosphate deaminase [Candidatus Woesearchaeota archaeon]